MGPQTRMLLALASEGLAEIPRSRMAGGRLVGELDELLRARNGFYAFECALHVFPHAVSASGRTLQEWNDARGWRGDYGPLAEDLLFFAEDVFGGQFALRDDDVITFDPETAGVQRMAPSIEDWADLMLADYKVLSGFPVAHEWQVEHGLIQPGQRLVPKIPFVLGGDYVMDNLYALDAVTGMRLRAELASQIRDLPDGTQVRYRVID